MEFKSIVNFGFYCWWFRLQGFRGSYGFRFFKLKICRAFGLLGSGGNFCGGDVGAGNWVGSTGGGSEGGTYFLSILVGERAIKIGSALAIAGSKSKTGIDTAKAKSRRFLNGLLMTNAN